MKNLLFILIALITFSSCTRIEASYEGILIKQYGTEKGINDVWKSMV